MNRNPKIQILRGIAIIAIILIHTCPRDKMLAVHIRPFINFGVALFLFLSGYLTKLENGEPVWMKFFTKRITRVLIPYIIWTVIYTLLLQSPDRIVFNLITARTAAHFYFIPVYIQFVLLTPLLWRLAKSKARWLGFLVSPLAVGLVLYPCAINGTWLPDKASIIWNMCFLGWTTFYYLGLCLGNHVIRISIKPAMLYILLAFSVLLQIAEGVVWNSWGFFDPGTQLKCSSILTSALVAVLAFVYLESPAEHNLKVLEKIGDLSFGIYLIHLLVQTYFFRIPLLCKLPYGVNSLFILVLSAGIIWAGQLCIPKKAGRYLGLY